MREFEVFLQLGNGTTDTYDVEARSPIEAAFYAGMKAGIGVTLASDASRLLAALQGVEYVRERAVQIARESLTHVLVEEL